ncbi:MAG: Heme A synthase [Alphaproteobacteria bacterium MarineAlpha9_Bin4]|nr:MAG: Heme A synthase [Alphaproteobacteria bacterium MarineAlpha9_Bin4]
MLKNYSLIIKATSSFLLFTIIIQILLGAWVRLTGSGMSCPDWPLCYGFFFPSYEKINALGITEYTYFQIFLEWIHRANAAFIIGPITIILFLYLIFNAKVEKKIKKYSYYLIILLGIQGLLGGLTVIKSNIPWSVAIHLASAFLLFYIVLNIFLLTFDDSKHKIIVTKFLKNLCYITLCLALITACAGAFTSKYGASLSCSSWPSCNEKFFPNISDQFEIIHFTHRVLAFCLVTLILYVLFRLKNSFKHLPYRSKVAYILIPVIIFLQIIIGASLIVFEIPIWMGIFHQFMGLLLFASITIMLSNLKEKS